MSVLDKIKTWFEPVQPLAPEVLHYQTPPEADDQYRLHLRIEGDGRGLLVVNAATILHLNRTATEYARLLIQGASEKEAVQEMVRRYRVSPDTARADLRELRDHILMLSTMEDLDPVTFLGIDRVEPFSAETSAPYRVDLALTYRVDETSALDPEAEHRVDQELSTVDWRCIIRSLWEVGVPHICFTGGEPTLRDDLVELITYAEELGMVTGLLTDGRRLRNQVYLDELLLAGLDHLQITLVSHRAEIHDAVLGRPGSWEETMTGLKNGLAGDIYVVVHVVVRPENADSVLETVDYLAELGVPAMALSSPLESDDIHAEKLAHILKESQEAVYEHNMTLVWDLAAPYSHVNPVEVETGLPAGQVVRQHLYVEPDGDALPAQGYNVVLGNLLRDSWESIWRHPEREKLASLEA
ncbi:MAG TPA: radical SAM protein [Chloroflexi bacterium]|nr:radical SAM protein [Chloroflexota bacterium]